VSDLLEEFEMAMLWVRSQHDVAKEKIFGFLQNWNDKERKHMFQILGRLMTTISKYEPNPGTVANAVPFKNLY
jgi:hypothetical protein